MSRVASTGVPVVIAGLTGQLTSSIADHGAYAIFALMALDALLPVGGELIMPYAGALGAGAISGEHPILFGASLATGGESYVILALAGAVGLPRRVARGLGDRRRRRPAAHRAPRPLAARQPAGLRSRRTVVRALRDASRLPRPHH